MFKKVIQGVVVGTAMFGLVGAAQAADRHINLYGASAQHLFWNDAAGLFLQGKGCSSVARAQSDGANGITRGLNCGDYGGDNVYIRYSSKASFDGIEAMKGLTTYTGTAEKCVAGDPGYPGPTTAGYYRRMVDETTCTWPAFPTLGSCSTTLKCYDVTLGASDVGGTALTQSSSGQLNGHAGGGFVSRTFNGIDDSGLDFYQPLIVPFGFFVNKSVKKDGVELENITRLMATLIFSGQITNWKDFGGNFSSLPVVACLRHAGSGTHATLDYAVMKGNGWGWPLVENQKAANPVIWFNDTTGGMMNCVNQANLGAIGYADADRATNLPANVKALKYQGEAPSRITIRNGIYDFWAPTWLYEDPDEPNYLLTHPVVEDLMDYASDPANVPAGKAQWWATFKEMVYMKATDQEYPGYVGAEDPETP